MFCSFRIDISESKRAEVKLYEVFNIACGATTTLLELWHKIKRITNSQADAILGPERQGDILHSLANVSKAASLINYTHLVALDEGLVTTIQSYKTQNSK